MSDYQHPNDELFATLSVLIAHMVMDSHFTVLTVNTSYYTSYYSVYMISSVSRTDYWEETSSKSVTSWF